MAQESLFCWSCGTALAGVPLPIGRRDACPACNAWLRACRMCANYDPQASKSCREPVADEVVDKEAATFCDYYRAKPGPWASGGDPHAATSRARLDAVFGGDGAAGPAVAGEPKGEPASEADRARARLEALFGKPKP